MKEKGVAIRRLAEADPRARELVNSVQAALANVPLNLEVLKNSLIALLEYLSSQEGRTDQNCHAVDSYFLHDDLWVKSNLPDSFHSIFADMSGALHDTVSAPDIAKNFDSTPEQLLKRARELSTEPVNEGDGE